MQRLEAIYKYYLDDLAAEEASLLDMTDKTGVSSLGEGLELFPLLDRT